MLNDFNKEESDAPILDTVAGTISDFRMFQPNDSVLVAVSGGPDSVALLHLLRTMAPGYPLDLAVAHLNHSMRSTESDRDAEFVKQLAAGLNLPCFLEKTDVHAYGLAHRLSPEEAARKVRYTFLYGVAQSNGFDKIALGHHGNDNAELVLMFLCRGSGPLGLSGIPPVRYRETHGVTVVRPLIRLKRGEIRRYLRTNGYAWVQDATNENIRYTRNRIRHQLIPALEKSYNPGIVGALNRLSGIVRDEENWLAETLYPVFQNCLRSSEKNRVVLSVAEFKNLHVAPKRRLLRMALDRVKGDLRRIRFDHIEAMCMLSEDGHTGKEVHLPGRIRVSRTPSDLEIRKENRSLRDRCRRVSEFDTPAFHYTVPGPGTLPTSVTVKEVGAKLRFQETGAEALPTALDAGHSVAFFDMDMLHFPIVARSLNPGDRFVPLGMSGHQKVNRFFINQKIDRRRREKSFVLADRNRIIWVVGHRVADGVKVVPSSRRILKAELFLD